MTSRSTIHRVASCVVLFVCVLSIPRRAAAQEPRLLNAAIERTPAGASLDRTFRSLVAAHPDPFWIGYAVPAVREGLGMCCGNWRDGASCCETCKLDPDAPASSADQRGAAQPRGPIALEPAQQFIVLYRVEQRRVARVRTYSFDCTLDAGGRRVDWITGVRAADSVALLETFTPQTADESSRLAEGVIAAIAFHADGSADKALDALTAPARTESIRKKAAFWLGAARGRHGFETLRRLMKEDQSDAFRKHVVFALTQSSEPEAATLLANVARTDASPRIRGEALFWIAQKGGAGADAIIAEALASDPSPEVKKKAVFALSQLKDDAGVPQLVEAAKSNPIAAVRSESLFWLSQKAGARATRAITDAIRDDPETQVRTKAVFALSQLPKDEGVPLLIDVAKTNKNPAVRKQAMFWLGQSKDPRAVQFFEEVLK